MTTKYNEFKIGDIMTTYHSGYWKLIDIRQRFLRGDEISPLFTYEIILTENFRICNEKKTRSCDASYCTKITLEVIENMKNKYLEGLEILSSLCYPDTKNNNT